MRRLPFLGLCLVSASLLLFYLSRLSSSFLSLSFSFLDHLFLFQALPIDQFSLDISHNPLFLSLSSLPPIDYSGRNRAHAKRITNLYFGALPAAQDPHYQFLKRVADQKAAQILEQKQVGCWFVCCVFDMGNI